MRVLPSVLLLTVLLAACRGASEVEYRFPGAVTACETREWAEERQELLESGDTAATERFASAGCFRMEPDRRVRVVDSEDGMPWGIGRWVEVETFQNAPLEHLASAELRRATGLPVRTRGWLAGNILRVVE